MKWREIKRRLLADPKNRKAYEEYKKTWGAKLTKDVMMAAMEVGNCINPKAQKAVEGEWLYSAEKVEELIWPLLRKTRRITQLEKKP